MVERTHTARLEPRGPGYAVIVFCRAYSSTNVTVSAMLARVVR
jgi:hypothetical protein